MEVETVNKGKQGNKRASWIKVHYRDLALKICEENPSGSLDELAELFLEQLKKYPAYMQSIAIYVMANTRASLTPKRGDSGMFNYESRVVQQVAAKVVTALMGLQMPNGKPLSECTGAECISAGGWFEKIGKRVGSRGIVGEKLTEDDLQKMWKGK